ncbi:helix-turn-helix transcriptional regulator [Acidithrix ferrooxidans]|uniref:Helix-turn-helix protein n=1 Tax=Acidithrix ferrooxidans TaxID=1280514 RepID=A0A0D8HJY0_9ACTN|nr:helix-turn-helix protein [Acidithrix ferrooxidans]
MVVNRSYRTIEEWETLVGEQVRAMRIANDLDQTRLAELANVSVGALSNLERGKGSSLKTVVAVVRALDRTDWIEALVPPVTVSPIQMLRAKRNSPRTRVRARSTDPQPSWVP